MTYEFTRENIAKIMKGIKLPFENMHPFWAKLSVKMYQNTMITFRLRGARDGHPRWNYFSPLTLHPHWKLKRSIKDSMRSRTESDKPVYKGYRYNDNKWNRRPGTDGAKTRRYSANSKELQASGMFRNSFRVFDLKKNSMRFGTQYKIGKKGIDAEKIIGKREVVFVTDQEVALYNKLFFDHVNDGMKV